VDNEFYRLDNRQKALSCPGSYTPTFGAIVEWRHGMELTIGMMQLWTIALPVALADWLPFATGAPPLVVQIGSFDKDKGVVALWVAKRIKVPYRVRVKEEISGKIQDVERELYKETTEVSYPKFKMADLRVFDGEGKPLRHSEVWPRLKRGASALLATDFDAVDPAFLAIVKKESLIFVPRIPLLFRAWALVIGAWALISSPLLSAQGPKEEAPGKSPLAAWQAGAPPRTVGAIVKSQGLPLFAAHSARVQAVGTGPCAQRLGRLVTTGYRMVESEAEARRLANVVLIYCTEPGERKPWGDLALAAHSVSARMMEASPLLGYGGPLPLARPFRITLAHVDRDGRVLRTETHNIVELAHAAGAK
jgi:hypothetical protein